MFCFLLKLEREIIFFCCRIFANKCRRVAWELNLSNSITQNYWQNCTVLYINIFLSYLQSTFSSHLLLGRYFNRPCGKNPFLLWFFSQFLTYLWDTSCEKIFHRNFLILDSSSTKQWKSFCQTQLNFKKERAYFSILELLSWS